MTAVIVLVLIAAGGDRRAVTVDALSLELEKVAGRERRGVRELCRELREARVVREEEHRLSR